MMMVIPREGPGPGKLSGVSVFGNVGCCECGYVYVSACLLVRNDHTNMTAPLPVCSAKLSMFGPG